MEPSPIDFARVLVADLEPGGSGFAVTRTGEEKVTAKGTCAGSRLRAWRLKPRFRVRGDPDQSRSAQNTRLLKPLPEPAHLHREPPAQAALPSRNVFQAHFWQNADFCGPSAVQERLETPPAKSEISGVPAGGKLQTLPYSMVISIQFRVYRIHDEKNDECV